MQNFEPGQAVEWRSQAGQTWTATGTYLGVEEGDWALVQTDDGDYVVRPELLRKPGELAAEDAALADLVERSKDYPIGDDVHAQRRRDQRGPWCDTCKRPTVAMEGRGLVHATAEHPYGSWDTYDHEVTHHEWYSVPRWAESP
jgi:hypothetical protein